MENHYNDENLFRVSKTNIKDKLNDGFISIPIYYGLTDDGDIMIDVESMKEEFERTVYGIETVLEFLK